MKHSFDKLPEDVATLIERVATLEALLRELVSKAGGNTTQGEMLLYTRLEAEALLKVSKPTIYKIDKKELPFFYIGTDRRYRVKDVEKYITNQIKKASGL